MEAPGLGWVMLLLLLELRTSGTANIPAQNPLRHRVDGLQGGSVLLPVSVSSSKRVAKIKWKFQPPTGLALVIAEFTSGKLERPNPGDRFGQRLEMAGRATLRIGQLELEDRGVYTARVRLASAVVEEHAFSCMVYGPVPEPQVRHQLTAKTAEGCNVTLQCLASQEGAFNISWKRGDQLRVPGEGSDWYRLSAEGTDLHVSWRPDSSDSTFACLLSNPVDRKSVSVDLLSICPSGGPGSHPAENPPLQVNGMLGGSALFPLKPPPTKTVARIEWLFQAGSRPGILIATFKDGKLEQQSTRDRFGTRLEMAEEATLRIRALEKEDSGALTVRVLFASGEVLKQTFRLSVFEPLPEPQMSHRLTSKTAEGCNVTLQCLVSGQGRFNVSWKRGNLLGALEGGADGHQLSAEGTDLQLSWQPSSSDSTYTCLLSNAVDQKNASFDLLSICQSEGASGCLSWVKVAMLVGVVVQIVTVALLNILDRTGQKQN